MYLDEGGIQRVSAGCTSYYVTQRAPRIAYPNAGGIQRMAMGVVSNVYRYE